MRENVIAKRLVGDAGQSGCNACYHALRNKKTREAAMVGMLAGLIAFFGMSAAVVVGAGILYDPERSFHHR
jgi:hypothetical protein